MKNYPVLFIIWILFTPGLKAQELKDEPVVKITGEVRVHDKMQFLKKVVSCE